MLFTLSNPFYITKRNKGIIMPFIVPMFYFECSGQVYWATEYAIGPFTPVRFVNGKLFANGISYS